MRDALTAEGHEGCQRVGIDAVLRQPALVESDEVEQVATSGVSCHEYLATAAIVLSDVLVRPCHRCCSIVEDVVNGSLGQQTVVGRHDYETAVFELWVDVLLAPFNASSVEPYHDGCVRFIRRIIHVEFAAFLCIPFRGFAIRDVVHLIVLRPCNGCATQKGDDEEIAFVSHSLS